MNAEGVMRTHFIGVDSWIIQDGNYGDFHVGEESRFALEFYPHALQSVDTPIPMAERLRGSRYRIRGLVAHTGPSVWVVDFGVLAYENRDPPPFARLGSWVEGTFYLGIDPLLIISWSVNGSGEVVGPIHHAADSSCSGETVRSSVEREGDILVAASK
ncbi:MAG: hypothetical protein ACHRXM_16690 [Isosphaerales bacterium]